jgi:hypothetical protein
MLSRALGYTELAYPMGFMINSRLEKVGLTGENAAPNLDISFELAGVAPTAAITRNQMAMLLWNFFGSNYVTKELIVDGAIMRTEDRHTPTLTRWPSSVVEGIVVDFISEKGLEELKIDIEVDTIVGYVVGIPGWAIDLNIADYDGGYKGPVILGGVPAEPENRRNPHDLVIGYALPTYTGTGANLKFDGYEDAELTTTRAVIGFEADVDLLGRKITFEMADGELVPGSGKIVGTKEPVDVSKTSLDDADRNNAREVTNVKAMTLSEKYATVGITDAEEFNLLQNLYVYNVASFGNTNNLVLAGAADLRMLGERIAHGANFRLTYINNGVDSEGFDEFFYIFEPFKVGVHTNVGTGNNVGKIGMTTAYFDDNDNWVNGGGGWERNNTTVVFADPAITALTVGEAYFYTNFQDSNQIWIHGILDKQLDATVATRNDASIRFNIPDPTDETKTVLLSKTINYRTVESRAIGAIESLDAAANNRYSTLFMDASGAVLLVRRGAEFRNITQPTVGSYGVVIDRRTVNILDGTTIVETYEVRIFDVNQNATRWIRVSKATWDLFGTATTTIDDSKAYGLAAGVYVRIGAPVDGLIPLERFSNVGALNVERDAFVLADEYATGRLGTTATVQSIMTSNKNSLYPSGNMINTTGLTDTNQTVGSGAHAQAVINSNTKIVMFSEGTYGALDKSGAPGFGLSTRADEKRDSVKIISSADFRDLINSSGRFNPGTIGKIVVVAATPGPGVASHVFVTISASFADALSLAPTVFYYGVVTERKDVFAETTQGAAINVYDVEFFDAAGARQVTEHYIVGTVTVGSFVRRFPGDTIEDRFGETFERRIAPAVVFHGPTAIDAYTTADKDDVNWWTAINNDTEARTYASTPADHRNFNVGNLTAEQLQTLMGLIDASISGDAPLFADNVSGVNTDASVLTFTGGATERLYAVAGQVSAMSNSGITLGRNSTAEFFATSGVANKARIQTINADGDAFILKGGWERFPIVDLNGDNNNNLERGLGNRAGRLDGLYAVVYVNSAREVKGIVLFRKAIAPTA